MSNTAAYSQLGRVDVADGRINPLGDSHYRTVRNSGSAQPACANDQRGRDAVALLREFNKPATINPGQSGDEAALTRMIG